MIARASTVGVGTALFYDPLVCVRINEGLAEYARGHDLDASPASSAPWKSTRTAGRVVAGHGQTHG